jgi:hypothetical protein
MDRGSIVAIQTWLIQVSLVMTGTVFVFLVAAPAVGYPLEYAQAFRIMQILLPVFVGYLGSAATYLLNKSRSAQKVGALSSQLVLVIRGPIYVFALGLVSSFAAFGYTNRASAAPGVGMSVDALTTAIAALLALLSATTGAAVSYLFYRRVKA